MMAAISKTVTAATAIFRVRMTFGPVNTSRITFSFSRVVLRRPFTFPAGFGLMLPAAVQPKVLFRLKTDHVLQCCCKALRQRWHGIGAVFVLFGIDDVGDLAFVAPIVASGGSR